jgi:hypothetical protein
MDARFHHSIYIFCIFMVIQIKQVDTELSYNTYTVIKNKLMKNVAMRSADGGND